MRDGNREQGRAGARRGRAQWARGRKAKKAVEATLVEITKQIAGGNEARLTGFGKFAAVHRAAREGRNPQTGASMQIVAKSVPKFSAGAELEKAVQ